jgi:uncharacterized membrane-anchored protein YjiN (DUF445 family)
MSMREELSAMKKGIKGVERQHEISKHVDHIIDNFVKKNEHSDDMMEYIQEIKPQSIRDGVLLRLIHKIKDAGIY